MNSKLSQAAYGVILAGGTGTRLWPLSRSLLPKQLLSLTQEESLLQLTVRRLLPLLAPDRIFTVTHLDQQFEVKRQLGEIEDKLALGLLVEPMVKNTLPAIAWATALITKRDPKAIISVFPSDHFIGILSAFRQAYEEALITAQDNYFVTLGVQPTHPAAEFGYIEAGRPLEGTSAKKIRCFVEKPDLETAQSYFRDGNFLWNSGIFTFRADHFQKTLSEYHPQIYQAFQRLADEKRREPSEVEREYREFPSLSIDYGIMEKNPRGAVIPVSMAWNDLGNWDALYQIMEKDDDKNVVRGFVEQKDSSGSLLLADHGLIASIGLKDFVVIKTDDTVLVSPRNRVQEVKQIVDRLRDKKSAMITTHRTVRRPWGTYTVLEETPHHKVKRIVVDPAQRISLQRHRFRSEHWIILKGTARITSGEQDLTLGAQQSMDIPQGLNHRLENAGPEALEIIEVQTGSYLGEDDIIRLDDDYGRTLADKSD